jgi:ribonuclease R
MSKRKTSRKSAQPNRNDIKSILQLFFVQNPNKLYSEENILRRFSAYGTKNEIIKGLFVLVKRGNIFHENGSFAFANSSPSKGEQLQGIVDMTQNGAAYILLDNKEKDIYIPARFTNKALDGDIVTVSRSGKNKNRPEGIITSIVHRTRTLFIGTIHQNGRHTFVVPSNKKIHVDFFIEKNKLKINPNDKVVVEFVEWQKEDKNPKGKIIEVIGTSGDNDAEMRSILIDKGFFPNFTENVLSEANKIPTNITESEIKARKDMRNTLTFTIDPFDAKDFDDAISFQKIDDDTYEIGVHIADVSHYIPEDSILDKEAYRRATSVYMVDRVAPMFPEVISNIICSLRPNEDKLCFACIFKIDKNAKVLDVWYGRTVIHSDKRFAYEQAQEILENKVEDILFNEPLHILNNIAHLLRKKRFSEGSINFDTLETKFKLDENGKPIGVYTKERKDAHLLIEDFMLLANKYVAYYIGKQKNPTGKNVCIYRIHDEPDEDKLADFALFAKEFGHQVIFDTPQQVANSLNQLMQKIEGKPEQHVLEQLAIRCMSKAAYSTENIGHYGLGFEYYSHFTSPIRRYPDIMTHRLLQHVLDNTPVQNAMHYENKCKHCSERERAAMEAERESTKYKMAEYLSDKIGQKFEGIISGVKQWGLFVEVATINCEGLVRSEDLNDDTYVYEEKKMRFRGQFTDKIYRLGDKVNIQLLDVDIQKRQIDFDII